MKDKILAIIVTYKPEKDILIQNISSIIHFVDKILIWENTTSDITTEYRFVDNEKIEYVGNGTNVGLSKAFNYAWKYAKQNDYSYLMTMDQDSKWINFEHFINIVLSHPLREQAIYSPSQSMTLMRLPFELSDRCINSGTFVSIKLLDTVGGYCETFFLDAIDHEFCARVKQFGFKIIKIYGCSLVQRYGSNEEKRFFGIRFHVRNYSPNRLYGLVRNTTITIKKYPNEKGIKQELHKLYMRKFVIRILLGEKNKIAKILSIYKGWIDGVVYGRKYKGLIKGFIFKPNDRL